MQPTMMPAYYRSSQVPRYYHQGNRWQIHNQFPEIWDISVQIHDWLYVQTDAFASHLSNITFTLCLNDMADEDYDTLADVLDQLMPEMMSDLNITLNYDRNVHIEQMCRCLCVIFHTDGEPYRMYYPPQNIGDPPVDDQTESEEGTEDEQDNRRYMYETTMAYMYRVGTLNMIDDTDGEDNISSDSSVSSLTSSGSDWDSASDNTDDDAYHGAGAA